MTLRPVFTAGGSQPKTVNPTVSMIPKMKAERGSALYIRLMAAGREMADQQMKSTVPANTAHQARTRITRLKPDMATSLNTDRARSPYS